MLRRFASALAAVVFFLPLPSIAQAATTTCYTVAACAVYSNEGPGPGGAGVEGTSQSAIGVYGLTLSNYAVYGRSTYNDGVVGETLSPGVAGVFGGSSYGYGVYGYSVSSYGVVGVSQALGAQAGYFYGYNGGGVAAIGHYGYALYASGVYSPTLELQDSTPGQSTQHIIEALSNNCLCFVLDNSGNVSISGTLTESGDVAVRTRSNRGADVLTYGDRTSAPTVEDFGTATLRGGVATVPLEATFASTIAPGFMVFVTPHGDSNGLYTVASKTSFTVHESKGGRSTLAFDYRIVARPLDTKALRLALAPRLIRASVRARAKPPVMHENGLSTMRPR